MKGLQRTTSLDTSKCWYPSKISNIQHSKLQHNHSSGERADGDQQRLGLRQLTFFCHHLFGLTSSRFLFLYRARTFKKYLEITRLCTSRKPTLRDRREMRPRKSSDTSQEKIWGDKTNGNPLWSCLLRSRATWCSACPFGRWMKARTCKARAFSPRILKPRSNVMQWM